jgi:hypothetical protein
VEVGLPVETEERAAERAGSGNRVVRRRARKKCKDMGIDYNYNGMYAYGK